MALTNNFSITSQLPLALAGIVHRLDRNTSGCMVVIGVYLQFVGTAGQRGSQWSDAWRLFGGHTGIVHRLDRNTTGCIVVAKTEEAHWHNLAKTAEERGSQC